MPRCCAPWALRHVVMPASGDISERPTGRPARAQYVGGDHPRKHARLHGTGRRGDGPRGGCFRQWRGKRSAHPQVRLVARVGRSQACCCAAYVRQPCFGPASPLGRNVPAEREGAADGRGLRPLHLPASGETLENTARSRRSARRCACAARGYGAPARRLRWTATASPRWARNTRPRAARLSSARSVGPTAACSRCVRWWTLAARGCAPNAKVHPRGFARPELTIRRSGLAF